MKKSEIKHIVEKVVEAYFADGGTLIIEDTYSVIAEDSIYIDSFYAEIDDEPDPQSSLRIACENKYVSDFKKKRRYDVYINGREGKNIKHFHVIAHDDSGDETCVQIPTNKYFTHGNKQGMIYMLSKKSQNNLENKTHCSII